MKVGLIGCGNIGGFLARFFDKDKRYELVCVFDKYRENANALIKNLKHRPKISDSFENFLKEQTDVVVEAASQGAVKSYAKRILDSKKDIMIMSVGALVDSRLLKEIRKSAEKNNRRVYVPSGAVCGIDGIKAASVGRITEVVLCTTKPPRGLMGAPFILDRKIDLKNIKKTTKVYEGYAKEAVKFFPENVNVCATLSLAGIGSDKTKVRIFVDPKAKRNVHEVYVKGDFGVLYTKTENVPSPRNPKTSYLVCLSAIETLRNMKENIYVGT